MADDFGDDLEPGLWSDASAAIAISQRSGLGKLRHIQTQFLWLQERVSAKQLRLTKVVGTANPADMLTKNLAKADLDRHLEFSGLILRDGRADGSLHVDALAPTCSSLGGRTFAALRCAMGPRVILCTPEMSAPIPVVGGYDSSICDWRRVQAECRIHRAKFATLSCSRPATLSPWWTLLTASEKPMVGPQAVAIKR